MVRGSSIPTSVLAAVPVFPLPDLVVFPGAEVPLHFFEPRYRALAEDVVANSGYFVTTQIEPGHLDEYLGQPPMRPIGTLVRVGAHRKRNDGTHDVVIEGVARGRLEELEPSSRGYRRARVSLLPDVGVDRLAAHSVQALVSCAQALAGIVRKKHPDFSLEIERFESPAALVDALAHRVVLSPDERQRLLETIDVRVRVARLLEILGDIVLRFGGRTGSSN